MNLWDQMEYIPDSCMKLENVMNESLGPDGIHPRLLYEVRNKIASALKVIFNHSLHTHQVPLDFLADNISPTFKKELEPVHPTNLSGTLPGAATPVGRGYSSC